MVGLARWACVGDAALGWPVGEDAPIRMTRDQPAAREPAAGDPDTSWTLTAAAALAAAEAVVLVVLAVGRDVSPPAIFFLGLKLVFCALVVRRRPGAFLALLLYEGFTVLVALVGTASLFVRLPLAASAAAVLVLLGRSAHLFPSPTLPRP